MRALCLVAATLVGGPARADDDDAAMGRKVQALLRAHQADVFACVAKQAEPATGEALLRAFVGAPGEPTRVEVLKVEQGKGSARVAADCVATAARRWDLSALGASPGDQIVFPLAFRPEPPRADAIGVRVEIVSLAPNSGRTITVQHPAALYVLGPGAPTMRYAGSVSSISVGELIYASRGLSFELVSKGLCAKQGVEVAQHEHAGSDELVYILSGQATTRFGEQQHVERPGDLVTIPRGTPHGLRVDKDLCAVQVYAPAGPEQRFKTPPRSAP
jgi:mannose-6-phosphate isomerase-like protein (cupin superfamily)